MVSDAFVPTYDSDIDIEYPNELSTYVPWRLLLVANVIRFLVENDIGKLLFPALKEVRFDHWKWSLYANH